MTSGIAGLDRVRRKKGVASDSQVRGYVRLQQNWSGLDDLA
jgi:hypothetical protein